MTTFEFNLPKKERDGADAIFKINRFLLSLLAERMKSKGMTRKQLAEILEVDKSTISKMLRGNQNVTARTIGEICGALDFDFELVRHDLLRKNANGCPKYVKQPSAAPKPSGSLGANRSTFYAVDQVKATAP